MRGRPGSGASEGGFTELYSWWHKIYTLSSCVPLNLEYPIQVTGTCLCVAIARNVFTLFENGALNKLWSSRSNDGVFTAKDNFDDSQTTYMDKKETSKPIDPNLPIITHKCDPFSNVTKIWGIVSWKVYLMQKDRIDGSRQTQLPVSVEFSMRDSHVA